MKNMYADLRLKAIETKPEQIGVKLDNNRQVFCAVIDMKFDENITTLVCVFNGTVSIYFSSGTTHHRRQAMGRDARSAQSHIFQSLPNIFDAFQNTQNSNTTGTQN